MTKFAPSKPKPALEPASGATSAASEAIVIAAQPMFAVIQQMICYPRANKEVVKARQALEKCMMHLDIAAAQLK